MKPIRQRIRRLYGIAIDWWTELIALILLVIGLVGYFRGAEPYVPIFTEAIGIGIAVLLIDFSNKFLAIRNEKERLILQMGSPDHGFAIEAVRQLRHRKWLYDGSLQGANLREADLSRAPMFGADLTGAYLTEASLREADLRNANLMFADLISADLMGADMSRADLMEAYPLKADLRGANLENADLIGADLREANLEGAINWKHAQLNKAKSLEGAIMPDGKVYNPETFKESLEEQELPE